MADLSFKTAYHGSVLLGKTLLQKGLEDDDWEWDWTTLGTLRDPMKSVRARVVAKAEGIWAGSPVVEAVQALSAELGAPVRVRSRVADGDRLKIGATVTDWTGPARMVLALERPFLNLVSYVSGIATATRELVNRVARAAGKGTRPRITCTRKTLPSYRDLAIHGVIVGGGWSHRISLSGGILIKENHIAAAGGIVRAVSGVRSLAPHGLKVEVEVRSLAELRQALKANADGVLLDNFTSEEVREAVQRIRESGIPVFVEVSGSLNEGNIARYAIPGVDVLSSGALTHSVRALDLSLLVQ